MNPSAIHRAVRSGDLDEMRRLLESGADPNETRPIGDVPLSYPAMRGDVEAVRLLLAYGADPNGARERTPVVLSNGVELPVSTPLVSAVLHSHATIARLLLEAGADPNPRLTEGSLLSVAMTISDPEVITLLLDCGACPPPGQGRLLARLLRDQPELAARVLALDELDLSSPAENGDLDRLRSRLANGADPNQADSYGMRPLLAAARKGQAEAVRLLLDAGAQIGTGSSAPDNPLVAAIGSGSAETVRLLLDRGADPNVHDSSYAGALTQAILAGPEISKLFTERGIALSTHQHAMLGNREAVLQALESGLSPDAHDESGLPLLHAAARSGCIGLVQDLLDRGADPAACDSHGNPVLFAAVVGGNPELVELLLTLDSVTHQRALDRAFEDAAHRGLRPIATLLRARGADPNRGAPVPPLSAAVIVGDAERLRWLLELGCSSEGGDGDTKSPIQSAILYGRPECLQILIEAGADVNASSASGCVPLELARLNRRPEMEAVLLAAGAVEPLRAPSPDRGRAMAAAKEWFEEQLRQRRGE